MSNHELEVDSVRKYFGQKQILSDVYLKCVTGEVIGLLGRNGSGKSTLLQIIFGTLHTVDKFIRIDNKVYQAPFKKGNLISYLPQKSFLPTGVCIKNIVKIFLDQKEHQARVYNDERVKYHLHKTVEELSGGERRYFEILLLLNLPTKFLLLDEPFSEIEPLYIEKIKKLISQYQPSKGIVITDYDYRNILDVSDRLILLHDGGCKNINKLEELEDFGYLPIGRIKIDMQSQTTEK